MTNHPIDPQFLGEEPRAPLVVKPPSTKLSPSKWLQANLFNSKVNSVITVVVGAILLWAAYLFVRWVVDIDFTIVRDTLRVFMIGSFPDGELWRLWAQAYLVVAGVSFASGARARDAYEQALIQGIPAEEQSLLALGRRFWPIIAVFVFFASFAKNLSPMILVATSVVLALAMRWLGWAAPASIRLRAAYLATVSLIASMLIVAGTSKFGGFILGFVLFFWVFTELRRGDPATSTGQRALNWVIPIAVGVATFLIVGAIGFEGFGWKEWGGLHVSIFTAIAGIGLGLPGGVLLALGRRSDLPVVKTTSVIFIEFVRGVPLISLLIFSIVFLPLFLPPAWETPASLTLAIVVIGGFSAAYIAEIVRGGLQAVASGQTEAAQALGLSPGAMQRLIILPQALRAVIPAMVGQFISLFKDTSLLFAAGVLEFLGASTIANNQPQFLGRGLAPVTLLFVSIGYWAFSYTMSRESRRLEERLNTGR